jgi:predicted ATP-grasp superfamily ATP-dependent carboligase
MMLAPRGLVIGGANRELVAEAFDRVGAHPTFCLVGERPVRNHPHRIEYVATRDAIATEVQTKLSKNEIDFVFPASQNDDWASLNAALYSTLHGTRCRYFGHSPATLDLFLDKVSTKELCLKLQIATPAWALTQEDKDRLLAKTPALLAKRRRGTSGEGQILLTPDSPDVDMTDGQYFFEEIVDGIEFTASLLVGPCTIAHYPLMVKGRTGAGIPHALEKPRIIADCYPPCFHELTYAVCDALARETGANGWLDCDFILTSDQLHLIEVNARYSGCTHACFLATEVNPYELHLRSSLGSLSGAFEIGQKRLVIELPVSEMPCRSDPGTSFQRHSRIRGSVGRTAVYGASLSEAFRRASSIEFITAKDWIRCIESDIRAFYEMASAYCQRRSKNTAQAIGPVCNTGDAT